MTNSFLSISKIKYELYNFSILSTSLLTAIKSGSIDFIEITFNKEETKAESVYFELTMSIGEDLTDEQIDTSKEYLIKGCESSGYKKCDAKISGSKLTYSFETTPELSNFSAEGKLEDVKKAAEEDGYSCK